MATKKKASATKKVAAPEAASKKTAPAKAAPKKKILAKAFVPNKLSTTEQIASLQAQMDELKKEAVVELKERLMEARTVVQKLEKELQKLTRRQQG